MPYDKNNIFAKIIKKDIAAKIIFENEDILAFEDISKSAPIHILVIPKGEYKDFNDFTDNASDQKIASFFKIVTKLSKDLKILEKGFRLITNIGEDAHQSVPHFHIHIIAGKKLGPLLQGDNLLR